MTDTNIPRGDTACKHDYRQDPSEDFTQNGKRYEVHVCIRCGDRKVYFALRNEFGTEADVAEYDIDERTCPNELFRRVEEVFEDGDSDPHGLLEYIRTIDDPRPSDRAYKPDEVWGAVFPEAFETPQAAKDELWSYSMVYHHRNVPADPDYPTMYGFDIKWNC